VSTAHDRWMISSIWCYHSRGLDCSRPIQLLLQLAGWLLPDTIFECYFKYKAAINIGPRPFSCSWTTVFTCKVSRRSN